MQPQRFLDFVDMNRLSIPPHLCLFNKNLCFIDAEFIIDEDRRVIMVRLVFMR